jgi:hypothetical protein
MTTFDELVEAVQKRFAKIEPIPDRAESEFGTSYLDCRYRGRVFSVTHSNGKGFGVSISGKSQDDCEPDEFLPTAEAVLERIEKVLTMIDDLESL